MNTGVYWDRVFSHYVRFPCVWVGTYVCHVLTINCLNYVSTVCKYEHIFQNSGGSLHLNGGKATL